jgi:hypothetical protein
LHSTWTRTDFQDEQRLQFISEQMPRPVILASMLLYLPGCTRSGEIERALLSQITQCVVQGKSGKVSSDAGEAAVSFVLKGSVGTGGRFHRYAMISMPCCPP